MGNFLISIEAVGGHGDDRNAKQGEKIVPLPAGLGVDNVAAEAVELVRSRGCSVVSATLTHWPDSTPIIDDVVNGVRVARDFKTAWVDEPLLQFFSYTHLPPLLQEASKAFCRLAHHICATAPRNAERTVALRKLLEAKDCAVRALIMKQVP
jgi:hypothetical protein